jgi:hypothetical protein
MTTDTLVAKIESAVRRRPGIESVDLARVLGVPRDERRLQRFSKDEEAQCAVDGGGRWWPTKNLSDLRPGDRIPRFLGCFEERARYEWVTVVNVAECHELFTEFVDVVFTSDDGTPHRWDGLRWYEKHPVWEWATHQ